MVAKAGVVSFWDNKDFLKGQKQYMDGIDQATKASTSAGASIGGISDGTVNLLSLIAQGTAVGLVFAGIADKAFETLGAITSFAVGSVSQLQDLEITLETLSARELLKSGSVENFTQAMQYAEPMAAKLMERIQALSLISPFEYKDILNTFQLSMGFGMASETALEFTRAVTNIAAVNKTIPGVLERITYNFSQMGMVGKITARDMRDLAQAGVNLGDALQTGLGMSIDEVNAALESGQITMEDVTKAFVTYADTYFAGAAERSSKTLSGLTSSFKDLAFFASSDVFKPALDRITTALAGVFDWARKIIDSGALKAIGAVLDIIAESAINAGQALTGWLTTTGADWATTIGGIANDALEWGANIAINLATGLINGAASAITAAINWISNLLSYWMAPGSPPRMAPDIDVWGAEAMNQYLIGMTNADFSILDDVQAPLRSTLQTLVDLGEITRGEMGDIFADISEDLIAGLSTGNIDTSIFDQLREAGGEFGAQLADLVQKQLELAAAEEQVSTAEQELADARKREEDAGKQVNALTAEYNQMLRGGASKEQLAAKMAELKAAKAAQEQAKKDVTTGEDKLDQAKEGLDLLKDQVDLAKNLLDTMLELAKARNQDDGLATIEQPKIGEGGAGGAGGGMKFPPIDTSEFENKVTDAFDNIRAKILEKLGGVWDNLQEMWMRKLGPALSGLQTAWQNLMNILAPVWENIKQGWSGFFNWASEEIQGGISFMGEWWNKHGQSVITVVTKMWEGLKSTFSGAFILIKQIITTGLGWIAGFWQRHGQAISQYVSQSWETLKKIFSNALEAIGNGFDFWAAIFNGDWATAWQEFSDTAMLIFDTLKLTIQNWLDGIGLSFDIAWQEIGDTVINKIVEIRDGIANGIQEAKNSITEKMDELSEWWGDTWESIRVSISEKWTQIVTTVTNKVNQVKTTIVNTISGIATSITQYVTDMYNAGVELVQGIIDGFASGDIAGDVGDAISDAVDMVWDYMGEMYDAGVELVQNIIDGVGDMSQRLLDALIDLVLDALGGLMDWFSAPSTPNSAGFAVGSEIKNGVQQAQSSIIPMAPVPVLAGGESIRNTTFNFNNNISGQMDVYALEALILRTVKRAMSR